MTVTKTVQRWEIGTGEDMAAFEQETRKISEEAERSIYHRTLGGDSEHLLNPYCGREEFLEWTAGKMRLFAGKTMWPQGVIVEITLFHPNGKLVRAEFHQKYGETLGSPYARHPNAGGIICEWEHEFNGRCYLVEGEDGRVRTDYDLYRFANEIRPNTIPLRA